MLGISNQPTHNLKSIMTILALDPSGTSITGYFWFKNWSSWKIGSVEGKNYLQQAKNLQILLKNLNPQILVYETSFWWKTKQAQKDLQELVYLNGVIGWLTDSHGCETKQILNHSVKDLAKQITNGKVITGLQLQDRQWSFKDQTINEHERDALIVFWIYWVRVLKNDWPFAD